MNRGSRAVWRCKRLSLSNARKERSMSRSNHPDMRHPAGRKGLSIRIARREAERAREQAARDARIPLMERLSSAGIPTTHDFQASMR